MEYTNPYAVGGGLSKTATPLPQTMSWDKFGQALSGFGSTAGDFLGFDGSFGIDKPATTIGDQAGVDTGEVGGWSKFGSLLQGAGAIMDGYNGWQQTKLQRKSLADNMKMMMANYNAQRSMFNAGMYDKNVRRNVEMGQSLADAQSNAQAYVDKRGIQSV